MNARQYKQDNENFLQEVSQRGNIKSLPKGIYYEVMKTGEGKQPAANSIVSVYYKGMLISGKVFDDNTSQGYPDAFRLSDLITGWQIALTNMHAGDQWRVYIPSSMGYGAISSPGIPKNSTLIFEIELVSVM